MIPAEIAVVCLLLFIFYQAIMSWLSRGKFEKELEAQKGEIDVLRRQLDVFNTDLDGIDRRVEILEGKRK